MNKRIEANDKNTPTVNASAGKSLAGWSISLSPFDPLVIQRKRLNLFFGYEHRFEAYVPAAKRVLGYFALPVLMGDEIVTALDLKADRQARKLVVQKWTWIVEEPRLRWFSSGSRWRET